MFSCVISNAVSYDNQIGPLVDSLAFFTQFSLDCASFMIVRHLRLEMGSGGGVAGKMSSKFEGAVADWFRNLATFIGSFYRNHPSVEIQGLFHFIVAKLNEGSTWELLIVKEVLSKVGGCEYVEQQSEEQVTALAGGETLRRELMSAHNEPKKQVRRKLQEVLAQPETGLTMLVLIAQQRNIALYHTETRELKLIGEAFDRCQISLILLVEFLSRQKDSYAAILPPLGRLVNELHVESQVALYMARPLIRAAAAAKRKDPSKPLPASLAQWDAEGPELQEQLRAILPPETWQSLSMECYTSFWGLTLQDIHVPKALYEQRIAALQKSGGRDHRDDRKQSRAQEKLANDLKAELEQREKHVETVLTHIRSQKSKFFAELELVVSLKARVEQNDASAHQNFDIILMVLANCVMPRVFLSEEDALFTAHFVHLLHELSPDSFSSLQFFDRIVKTLVPTVFSITERESAHLGIFLRHFLEPIIRWYGSLPAYLIPHSHTHASGMARGPSFRKRPVLSLHSD